MPPALDALMVIAGFLAGSIPFGVLFARARGVDLTKIGSGNIGATNAARALGRRVGLLVFLCDAAKGTLPVLAARHLGAGDGAVAATGAAAFLGHLYSPWLGFRGGKGVATAFGVFLALSPAAALIAFVVFAALYATTRVSSIGSLASATVFLPALALLGGRPADLWLSAFVFTLIVWKHRGNIGRIARRQEGRV